jgi:hypothetical protein
MPLIHVYFFQPPDTDPYMINHVVKRYDGPYSHCDVQFEDGMASSVFQNETVYFKLRKFRKPGYSRVTLSVPDYEYGKAYRLCKGRFDEKMEFDGVGMYSLPFPGAFLYDRENKSFCSKHVCEVLQEAGVRSVASLISREQTPSSLHRALGSSRIFHIDQEVVASLRVGGR